MVSDSVGLESGNERIPVECAWQKKAGDDNIRCRCEPERVGCLLHAQWREPHMREVLSVHVSIVAFGLNEQNDGESRA
jgi:hypothetical protein